MSNETTIEAEQLDTQQETIPEAADQQSQAEAPTQEAEPKLSPEDSFREFLQLFDSFDPATLLYIVEKRKTDLTQTEVATNAFSKMETGEAAALLVALESKRPPVESDAIEDLKTRVLVDRQALPLYYPEHIGRLDNAALMEDVKTLADELKITTAVDPIYLRLVVENIKKRSEEIATLVTGDPEAQAALLILEKEWTVREEKLKALIETFSEVFESTEVGDKPVQAGDELPLETAVVDPEESVVLPDDSEVKTTEQTEGGLEVTVETPTGEKQKFTVTEPNMWSFIFLASMSDVLLGTNKIANLAELWTRHKVVYPLLEKLGVSSEVLSKMLGAEHFDAFDNILKNMNSQQCEEFFSKAVQESFLFETLERCRPEHLEKIFATDGPKAFGKTGYYGTDHLELSPELVGQMKNVLTAEQKRLLNLV
jgi:hypothetical protein